MMAVANTQQQQLSNVNGPVKGLELAWNTIYNVLHLNRIRYDPEDAARTIRHSLLSILEAVHSPDTWSTAIDYLVKNETLMFLAEHSRDDQSIGDVICVFFTYFIEGVPGKALLVQECIDAIQVTLLKANANTENNKILLMTLLQRMRGHEDLAKAYALDVVVRGALEPFLTGDCDVSLLCMLAACIEDYDYADLNVYAKALSASLVNAVMTDDYRLITSVDCNLLQTCTWEQFRVSFVEAVRTVSVPTLAASDMQLLLKLFLLVNQPELTVPIGTVLLKHAIAKFDFDLVKIIHEKARSLIVIDEDSSHDDLNAFPIDKKEFLRVLDKQDPDGKQASQLYEEQMKRFTSARDLQRVPVLKESVKRIASQVRISPDSPLEHILLMTRPIPVCMPTTPRICAYYLAYLQAHQLFRAQ